MLVVAVPVAITLIFILPRLAPVSSPSKPLGPGPYYLHYDCGNDRNGTSGMVNEGTANGGNTGIGGDYKTLAERPAVASIETGIVKTDWCSTSKNPADTHA